MVESLVFAAGSMPERTAWTPTQAVDLHSFPLARNGVVLAEVHFHPYHAQFLHGARSVAKSIMSLLVGMALDDGHLRSIDTPMLSFFPGRTTANSDPRKEAITLRHLLSMASGMALSDPDTGAMMNSPSCAVVSLARTTRKGRFMPALAFSPECARAANSVCAGYAAGRRKNQAY